VNGDGKNVSGKLLGGATALGNLFMSLTQGAVVLEKEILMLFRVNIWRKPSTYRLLSKMTGRK